MAEGLTVSVVIPTYNHGVHVEETLASVFAQTLGDVEVIVVNDGSPDDTEARLRPLAEAGRIRYVRQANQGQAAARNAGLKLARGEFVALLDDDDLWPADKLAWQVEALRREARAVMVYGYATSFDARRGDLDTGWPRGDSAPAGEAGVAFLRQNWIVSPGQTLIRRTALEAIGGFDLSLWGADDWDLYQRLAARGTFVFQDRCALRYRFHTANASRNFFRMYQNCRKITKRNGSRVRSPEERQAWRAGRAWVDGHFLGLCEAQAMQNAREENGRAALVQWKNILVSRPGFLFRRSKWRAMAETWRLWRGARRRPPASLGSVDVARTGGGAGGGGT